MAIRRSTVAALLPATTPISPLSKTLKLKRANLAVANQGVLKKFKTLGTPISFGFNATNLSAHGNLKLGPGVSTVDFDARRAAMLAGNGPYPNWPVTLNVLVETGYFYVIDVFGVPTSAAVFSGVSNRTSSGANFTTSYSITVDTNSPHALFVLQAHGVANGTKNGYRIEMGADQPWTFAKIEVTRVN